MIMTFVGVNNLTNKVYEGKVEPVFESVSEIMEETTDSYTKLKEDLEDRRPHIVISQIVGIYIDAYNKYVNEGRWFYQQNELNMSMPLLAHTVNFINRTDNLVGQWITGTIHDYVNHKLYNRYAKLKEVIKTKWSKKFTDAIVKNWINLK